MPPEVKEAGLAERAHQMVIAKYQRREIEFTENEKANLKEVIANCIKEDKLIKDKEFNGFASKLWAEAEARFFFFEFGIDIIGYLAGVGNPEAEKSRFECLKADINARRENKIAV